MLFFLRKFIEALFLPIGFSGLLVIAAIILRRRWIAIVGIIVLYAFSTQFTSTLMLWSLERLYEPKAVAAAPEADAIVVLGGGVMRGSTASGVQWGESANRYFAGRDLAMLGKAKFLIISPGTVFRHSATLRKAAILQGIRPERVILTRVAFSTEDEARAVSEIPGIHSILLVTSAFHMPRAVLLFRSRGLDVYPFPTDERDLDRPIRNLVAFIPAAGPLHDSEQAMREYYGLVLYRMILPFQRVKVNHE